MPHRDEDYLILSTIHSAKGQEWKRVFVLNCVDGCIPSDLATGSSAEIEEERRLFYVAMTRARDELHLVQPQRFYVHGQHRQRRPPRLRHRAPASFPTARSTAFAPTSWPPPAAAETRPRSRKRRACSTSGARMRAMWG